MPSPVGATGGGWDAPVEPLPPAGDLFDLTGLPVCSMPRQVAVIVGTLAACASLGALVASVAYRTLIERKP